LERRAQFAGRRSFVVVADLQVGSGKNLTSLKAGHYILFVAPSKMSARRHLK
jgi:hypothetical protein